MGIAIQKSIILLIANSIFVAAHSAHASTFKECAEAPLTVSKKTLAKCNTPQNSAKKVGKTKALNLSLATLKISLPGHFAVQPIIF